MRVFIFVIKFYAGGIVVGEGREREREREVMTDSVRTRKYTTFSFLFFLKKRLRKPNG